MGSLEILCLFCVTIHSDNHIHYHCIVKFRQKTQNVLGAEPIVVESRFLKEQNNKKMHCIHQYTMLCIIIISLCWSCCILVVTVHLDGGLSLVLNNNNQSAVAHNPFDSRVSQLVSFRPTYCYVLGV